MEKRSAENVFLTRGEVAAIFHVSAATITRWAKARRLPFVRTLGGHHRFPEREIRRLAAQILGPQANDQEA